MSLFVLDTDLLTLYYRGDPIVVRSVDARPATDLAISALTVDEQLTGWYYPGTEEAHTNPTRQRGECLRALAGASG